MDNSYFLASLDASNNFINKSRAYQELVYNEFYGPPGTRSNVPQNPLDRFFALQRLSLCSGDPANPPSINLMKKRAIYEELEKVKEILRNGPPKVVECPPWSRHVKPFCNIKKDDTVPQEMQTSSPPKTSIPGINICLSTHVCDNERAVTGSKMFFPFSHLETTSETQTVALYGDVRVDSTTDENLPGPSNFA